MGTYNSLYIYQRSVIGASNQRNQALQLGVLAFAERFIVVLLRRRSDRSPTRVYAMFHSFLHYFKLPSKIRFKVNNRRNQIDYENLFLPDKIGPQPFLWFYSSLYIL